MKPGTPPSPISPFTHSVPGFGAHWRPTQSPIIEPWSEDWTLRIQDAELKIACSIRFGILLSRNGFRQTAEVWANVRESQGERTVLKQGFDIRQFRSQPELRIGDSELTPSSSRGTIVSKGNTLEWDLQFTGKNRQFRHFPGNLKGVGFREQKTWTLDGDLRVTGTLRFKKAGSAEVTYSLQAGFGVLMHGSGPRLGDSSIWAHCSQFESPKSPESKSDSQWDKRADSQAPESFYFEGVCKQRRLLGKALSPRLSTLFFVYQGKEYFFGSLWDALRVDSRWSWNEWQFRAQKGPLTFVGSVHAENRDFTGFSYEDTDGSLLFAAEAPLCPITISVYRNGKLEATYKTSTSGSLLRIDRSRNPYVSATL
jgi:hypothetical protein